MRPDTSGHVKSRDRRGRTLLPDSECLAMRRAVWDRNRIAALRSRICCRIIDPSRGRPRKIPPQFRRTIVDYPTVEASGTIIIDTPNRYLYLTLGHGRAIRYGVGVGREGFTWSGTERISRMKEWPDWVPPKEMITRQPYLPRFMAGGETNPLGARAMYLGNTEYRHQH